jgi:nucleotide-binding universal stress UspA family protein
MALKDLLVYVDQTDEAFIRLRLAADLAIRHGSRLTALFAREWTSDQMEHRKAAELGLVSVAAMKRLDESIEASIDDVTERLRQALNEATRDRGPNTRATPISASSAATSRKDRCQSTIPSRSSSCS